jgi:phage terminase Nu1 subunit (DNA packaging protein)
VEDSPLAEYRSNVTKDPHHTDRHLPKLVNLNGAAEILGVRAQYVHRLAERGQLVGQKVGASWMFRQAVVERLRDQRAGGKEDAPPA